MLFSRKRKYLQIVVELCSNELGCSAKMGQHERTAVTSAVTAYATDALACFPRHGAKGLDSTRLKISLTKGLCISKGRKASSPSLPSAFLPDADPLRYCPPIPDP
ncbi:hypothetical protein EVAR_82783_1 [Eumeta japonica]|uniref:Uncharacterized protein n=1 Tax=Eumeta variegata TaxID=151549 RepID=A0A4C1UPG7_EUMVA|nr:hypothetical protein EVAR_82783_1 [Eumeta japonica]